MQPHNQFAQNILKVAAIFSKSARQEKFEITVPCLKMRADRKPILPVTDVGDIVYNVFGRSKISPTNPKHDVTNMNVS